MNLSPRSFSFIGYGFGIVALSLPVLHSNKQADTALRQGFTFYSVCMTSLNTPTRSTVTILHHPISECLQSVTDIHSFFYHRQQHWLTHSDRQTSTHPPSHLISVHLIWSDNRQLSLIKWEWTVIIDESVVWETWASVPLGTRTNGQFNILHYTYIGGLLYESFLVAATHGGWWSRPSSCSFFHCRAYHIYGAHADG